jgi:hypothetical protein
MADALFLLQSFTNHLLYISFQPSKCYYFNSWDHHLASIDRRYGLDKDSQAISSAQFWSELKRHLLSLVKQHTTRDRTYSCQLPFTVLVTAKAADTPEFLDVVHSVVGAIPGLCGSESTTAEGKGNGKAGHVELVIPDE